MLLVVDIGNTNTVLGLYEGDRLRADWRLSTHHSRTPDEWGIELAGLFALRGIAREVVDAAIIYSVVPPLTGILVEMIQGHFGVEPLIVGPGVNNGIRILYENPQEVGADRIVNSVAALASVGGPAIVIDFGTATTFDYISAKGEYVGGVITPGPGISLEALYQRAAKLYRVEMTKPPRVVGRNTVHAIQSGIIFGYVAMVDGLVRRIQQENGVKARVLATGGFAELLAPESETIEEVDEFLTLDGLRILHERNR